MRRNSDNSSENSPQLRGDDDNKIKENVSIQGKCMHIVLEYADSGDMQNLIQKQKIKRMYYSEKELWRFAWQMCIGVLHLHSRGVIHRDIKCMNLLLTGAN